MISPEAKEVLDIMRRGYGPGTDPNFPPNYFDILNGGFVDQLVNVDSSEEWEAGLAKISDCINHQLIIRTDNRKLCKILAEQFRRWNHVLEPKGRTTAGLAIGLRVHESLWNTLWTSKDIEERVARGTVNDPNCEETFYQKMLLTISRLLDSKEIEDQKDGMKLCLNLFKAMGRPDEQGRNPKIGDLDNDSSLPAGDIEFPRANIIQLKGWGNPENIHRIAAVKVSGQIVTLKADDVDVDEDGRNVSA